MAAHNLFYSRSSSTSSTAALKPPVPLHQPQRSASSTNAAEPEMSPQGPPYPLPLEIRLEAEQDEILRRVIPLHRFPSSSEADEGEIDVQKTVGSAAKPKYSLPDISNDTSHHTLGQVRPPPIVDMPTPQATLLLNFGAKLRTIMHPNSDNNHRPPAAPTKINQRRTHQGQRDYRAVSMVCDDPSYPATSASFLDVSVSNSSADISASHERMRSTSATPPVAIKTTKQQQKELREHQKEARQQQISTPTEFRQTNAAASCSSPHGRTADDDSAFFSFSEFCGGAHGKNTEMSVESSGDTSSLQMRPKSKSVGGIFAKLATHSRNRRERCEKVHYSEIRAITDQKKRDKNFDEFHSLIATNAGDETDMQDLRARSKSQLGRVTSSGINYGEVSEEVLRADNDHKATIMPAEEHASGDAIPAPATSFSRSAMQIFRSRTISSEYNRAVGRAECLSRHRRGASEKRGSQRRKTLYEEIQ